MQATEVSPLSWPSKEARALMVAEMAIVRPWLDAAAWQSALVKHPDQHLANRIVGEITTGTHIRYTGNRHVTKDWDSALPRNAKQRKHFEKALTQEIQRGHVVGPVRLVELPWTHYTSSPVCIVPKSNGSYRLIHDLTVRGAQEAVNNFIDKEEFKIRLPTLRDTVEKIVKLKSSAPNAKVYLWKEDVTEAFYHIKVHPDDRPFIVFRIGRRYFLRTSVSFGGRSSPGLWYEITELLLWILADRYGDRFADLACYVDDFQGMDTCKERAKKTQERFRYLKTTRPNGKPPVD